MAETQTVKIATTPINSWATIERAMLTAETAAAKLAATGDAKAKGMVFKLHGLHSIAFYEHRACSLTMAGVIDDEDDERIGGTDD